MSASSSENRNADTSVNNDDISDTNNVAEDQPQPTSSDIADRDQDTPEIDIDNNSDALDPADEKQTEELVTAVSYSETRSSDPDDAAKLMMMDPSIAKQEGSQVVKETNLQRTSTSITARSPQTPGAFNVVSGSGDDDERSEEEYNEDHPDVLPSQEEPAQVDEEAPLATTSNVATSGRDITHGVPAPIVLTGESVECDVRERIMREAVVADVIDAKQGDDRRQGRCHPVLRVAIIAVVLVLVVLIIALPIHFTRKDSNQEEDGEAFPLTVAPTSSPSMMPILETVRRNGRVRCGVYTVAPGFILLNEETGRYEGMSADLCRAVSAIVFDGDIERVEFVPTTATDRYDKLVSGALDVVSQTVTHTMERDVAERTSGVGFNFAPPFHYSGTGFGGLPEFVDCAERLDSFFGVCRDLRVCVGVGTTQEAVLLDLLPGPAIVQRATPQDMFWGFANGDCQIFASDLVNIPEIRIRATGYEGPYKLGTRLFSRDPLCLLTVDHDSEWASMVDLIMHILITAEAHNITKASVESWGTQQMELGVLDEILIRRTVDVVGGVGNFGELYELNMEPIVPRNGVNFVNIDSSRNSTGLLYPFPFGDLRKTQSVNLTDTTFGTVLGSGQLRCAIVDAGQDALSDFHEQFCKALAAALFLGDVERAVVVSVANDDGAFDALENDEVNLIVGAHVTLESLSRGIYSFSTPTYFDEDGGALALATFNSDSTWSDFVNWVVVAIIHAEEENVTQTNSLMMPVVDLYGENLKQMFRDCIAAVGNYGDIYNRTFAQRGVPRTGRNRLNEGLDGPQHFPIPFQ